LSRLYCLIDERSVPGSSPAGRLIG